MSGQSRRECWFAKSRKTTYTLFEGASGSRRRSRPYESRSRSRSPSWHMVRPGRRAVAAEGSKPQRPLSRYGLRLGLGGGRSLVPIHPGAHGHGTSKAGPGPRLLHCHLERSAAELDRIIYSPAKPRSQHRHAQAGPGPHSLPVRWGQVESDFHKFLPFFKL